MVVLLADCIANMLFNAIASGDKSAAEEAYKAVTPVLDNMARKGLIHKNKAARYKSRLNTQIRAL